MSQTTGPVLAMGGITVINQTVFNSRPMDWRVPIATGLLAVGFTFAEKVWREGAVILAWTGLAAVLLTRLQPTVPSPAESALTWWSAQNPPPPSTGGRNTA